MKRLRSVLFVPGHKSDWVRKAVASGADAIVLDLEDSVPVTSKDAARASVAQSIAHLYAERAGVTLYVRPNALETRLTGLDLEAVIRVGLDGLFLPKVTEPADLIRYDALVDYFAHLAGVDNLEYIVPIETAQAIICCEEIAVASPRIRSLIGPSSAHADIARAIGYRWTPDGLETLYLRSRILLACRAASLHPITGLWEDVHHLDGLRVFAQHGRQLGYAGQVVIHPSHVAIVNEVYDPDPGEVAYLERLVEALESAETRGDGAVLYEGQHIDRAHAETARERLADLRTEII